MYYFGYGMNTNKCEMAMRCPAAVSLGASVLPKHKFEFRHHADVREEAAFETDGVLWKITDNCLNALDMLEGYPHYYDRKTVNVKHPDLGVVEALVYFMNDQRGLAPPSNTYYEMLHEGYSEHGVDTGILRIAEEESLYFEIGTQLV